MKNARFSTAQQVFESFPDMASDVTSAPSDDTPLVYVKSLLGDDSPENAVGFCADPLNRREAVWWGCQSARKLGAPANRAEEVALLTAEAWVQEPEEHRRLAALDLALNGEKSLPCTWLAMGAGGAGGHMGTATQPGPPVPPFLTPRSISWRDPDGHGQCATA